MDEIHFGNIRMVVVIVVIHRIGWMRWMDRFHPSVQLDARVQRRQGLVERRRRQNQRTAFNQLPQRHPQIALHFRRSEKFEHVVHDDHVGRRDQFRIESNVARQNLNPWLEYQKIQQNIWFLTPKFQ